MWFRCYNGIVSVVCCCVRWDFYYKDYMIDVFDRKSGLVDCCWIFGFIGNGFNFVLGCFWIRCVGFNLDLFKFLIYGKVMVLVCDWNWWFFFVWICWFGFVFLVLGIEVKLFYFYVDFGFFGGGGYYWNLFF